MAQEIQTKQTLKPQKKQKRNKNSTKKKAIYLENLMQTFRENKLAGGIHYLHQLKTKTRATNILNTSLNVKPHERINKTQKMSTDPLPCQAGNQSHPVIIKFSGQKITFLCFFKSSIPQNVISKPNLKTLVLYDLVPETTQISLKSNKEEAWATPPT